MSTSAAMIAPAEARTDASVLDLTGITAGYGRTVVIRNVNLSVRRGSINALLGANGAGKTTLLRVASGLLRSTAGVVRVDGVDHSHTRPSARAAAGVCLIPEGRGVFRSLTVRENLALQVPRWNKAVGLDGALESFPILRSRLNQSAGSLSGGEQQMLALARCYLANPSVILLDEVSMGLAPLIVDQIFDTLSDLASQGIALLLVEQYISRALEMAETVHLLTSGELSFSGPCSELDADAVVRGYLGADLVTSADTAEEAPGSAGS